MVCQVNCKHFFFNNCSCGSVVRALRQQRKGCGFDSQGTHVLKKKKSITCMHCKSLWIKASAKCIKKKKNKDLSKLYTYALNTHM